MLWARKGLEQEIRETEERLLKLRQRLLELGGSAIGQLSRTRKTRQPMTEATRKKLQEAQLRRWEARREMEKSSAKARK